MNKTLVNKIEEFLTTEEPRMDETINALMQITIQTMFFLKIPKEDCFGLFTTMYFSIEKMHANRELH